MKKLRLFLLFAFALIEINANAVIEFGPCGDNVTYQLEDDGTLVISGSGDMFDYSSLTKHAPWYYHREKIINVQIDNGVTSIGKSAFVGCSALSSFTISNSVTSIGENAFVGCSNVKELIYAEGTERIVRTGLLSVSSVCIPSSATSIDDYAFLGCSNLASITIPNSVVSIGVNAFQDCISLPVYDNLRYADTYLVGVADISCISAKIKETTRFIGDNAFKGCSNLNSINIPNSVTSISWNAFAGCSNVKELIYEEGTNKVLRTGLTSISSVCIPSSVTSIDERAFDECSYLTSVIIPNSVTSIGESAFRGCTELTSVIMGISVTSIGDSSFTGCKSLSSIIIPNSVTSIGGKAFSLCTGLTSVTISNSLTDIGYSVFYECTGLTSVTIPNSVTSIGENAFYGCTNLTSITIPNSVSSVGDYAFRGCSSLPVIDNLRYADTYLVEVVDKKSASILIKEGTRFVGSGALSGCSGLTSATIPNSVSSIGNSAFSDCLGLTSVTIGNSVTSIGEKAFSGCSNIKEIHCLAVTPPIASSKTYDGAITKSCKLYVPTESLYAYMSSQTWQDFEIILDETFNSDKDVIKTGKCGDNVRFILHTDGTLIISGRGDMENYDSYSVPWYDNRSNIIKIQIEDGVTSIGNAAFLHCSDLTSVTISNSVKRIEGFAFSSCSGLTSVTIPNSVTSIGNGAFSSCSGLISVTIPNSVNSIGNRAFMWCSSLTSVTIPNSITSIGYEAFYYCTGLTSVTIPNSVTSIGDEAFYKCSGLTSVTIPNSITSIGYEAFSGCSGLTSVTIPYSVTKIGNQAFSNCTKLKEFHSQSITPPTASSSTFSGISTNYCKLYVPTGTREDYAFAEGWKTFINIIEETVISDDDGENKCAAPTIEYVDGHLKFSSTTPDATYVYTITDDDIKTSLEECASGDVALTATYNVVAYAKAEGYGTSNATTKTIQFGTGGEDIDALKAQIRSLQAQNSALESEVSTLKTENESLTKENSALDSKNKDLAAEVSGLKDDVKTLESENSALESENTTLKETIKKYAEGDLNLDGRTNIDDVVYLLKLDSYSSDTDALALLLDGSTAITLSEITDKYGDVEFYTLNGVKVNIPNQTGIYIVKKNGETKMVVVKK